MKHARVTHMLALPSAAGEVAFAGMERHAVDLAEGLTARGVDVELILLMAAPHPAITKRIAEIAARVSVCLLPDDRPLWTARKRLPIHVAALLRTLAPRRGGLVHLHLPNTDLMQVLTARPFASHLVATQHSAMPHFQHLQNLRWRMKVADRFIDRYVAVSDDVQRSLAENIGIAPEKIELVDYGIPVPSGPRDRAVLRAELGIPEQAFAVGYLGRLVDMKNVDVLIDAAARVPGLRLEIVGEGPDRIALTERARALGATNVAFHGWRSDSRELVRAFDLVALVSDFEGKPLSLLEAMLAGIPTLGSAVSGTRNALGDGRYGTLVPKRDVEAVVTAFKAALADRDALRTRAAEAERHAHDTYSSDKMVDKIMRLYQRLATSHGRVAG